jgi:SAM-dependent methyltransferase
VRAALLDGVRPTDAWDREYERAGIPSSHRSEPSGALVWALDNWARAGGAGEWPARALDVGCGTGRNAIHLAGRGTRVTAFDSSERAVEIARARVAAAGLDLDVRLHDLRAGVPAEDGEVDLVVDTFVYKHQVDPGTRRAYRRELLRVLAPSGRVLISLADRDDGYYASCPPGTAPGAVTDPETGVESILFGLEELAGDVGDALGLVMAWRKEVTGWMHGRRYARRTLATLWRPRTAAPAA